VKNQQKALDKKVDELFDQQAIHFNNVLADTQSEHNRERTNNEKETLRVNQLMA